MRSTAKPSLKIMNSLLSFLLVGAPWLALADQGAGDSEMVDVRLSVNLNVRSQEKDLLVSDSVIPAGAIIQVPMDEFENARKLPYWKNNSRRELEFVRGIRIVSAPGLTAQQVKKLNSWQKQEGLFMAKSYLAASQPVTAADGAPEAAPGTSSVSLGRATPVFRNDGVPNDEPKAQPEQPVDPDTANTIVNQIQQGNETQSKLDPATSVGGCKQSYIDKWEAAGVPAKALAQSLAELKRNPRGMIHNKRFITIVDFTKPSNARRMFVLDTQTGNMQNLFTSNGRNSETRGNMAGRFSNSNGSKETPAGFHVTGFADAAGVHTTQGIHHSPHHGDSLLLVGLEKENSNSAAREILIHSAPYASDAFVQQNGRAGRSFGCLAIDPSKLHEVLSKIEGGSLVYNYTGTGS